MNQYSAYWSETTCARRTAGLDDAGMVEVGVAVVHDVSFNTIGHDMMLGASFRT
jgi:hypothetical protein